MKLIYFFLLIQQSVSLFFNSNRIRQISYNPYFKQNNKKIFIIDVDGTICTKTNSDYLKAKPICKNIEMFNTLFDEGHEIHYWTARGALSGKIWDDVTKGQLQKWNVKYNSIIVGKPHYDVWVDDKAININDFEKYININN